MRMRAPLLLLFFVAHVVVGQDYLQKLEAASKEAWSYGPAKFLEWGSPFSKRKEARPTTRGVSTLSHPPHPPSPPPFPTSDVPLNHTLVFSGSDTIGTDIACFRIPSIIQTSTGVLVAFAEARGRFPMGSCADCSALGIATKRSMDGGLTWGALGWAVVPSFRAGSAGNSTRAGYRDMRNAGGNPVALFDPVRKQILLHIVRGGAGPDPTDCVPGTCVPGILIGLHAASPRILTCTTTHCRPLQLAGGLHGRGRDMVRAEGHFVLSRPTRRRATRPWQWCGGHQRWATQGTSCFQFARGHSRARVSQSDRQGMRTGGFACV